MRWRSSVSLLPPQLRGGMRKILKSGAFYGVLLTLLVAAVAALGYLDAVEHFFYDLRARYCQFFNPPPTDRLVHLDIDDAALDAVGGWPWPRATLAEMVDEMRLAGPKAVAFDIIFQDHPSASARHTGNNSDGDLTAPGVGAATADDEADGDQLFAGALARLHCALIPLVLPQEATRRLSPMEAALHQALSADLELSETDTPAALARLGIDSKQLQQMPAKDFLNLFLGARRDAMRERLMSELSHRSLSQKEVRRILLPHTDSSTQSPAVRLLNEEYLQVTSELSLVRFSRPPPAGALPMLHAESAMAPVAAIAKAAAATGFVDNPKSGGGILRRLPLFMEHDGRIYPQIGLSLAAMMLDVDVNSFTFTENRITLPRKNADAIVIPVYAPHSDSLGCAVPTMFDIPWFGPNDNWEAMYDKVGGAHLSMNVLWDVCLTRRRLSRNNAAVDDSLRFLYEAYAPEKLKPFNDHPLPAEDPLARLELARAALAEYGPFIESAEQTNLADIKDPADRENTARLAALGRALRSVMVENPKLQSQLLAQREFLKGRLHDRALLIGWTSTAQTFDEVATSIHSKCPGVVVHGVIFNAIMTGNMRQRSAPKVNTAVIVIMGLMTTLIAMRLSPTRALFAAGLLAAGFSAVNGVLVFNLGHHILTLGGPLVAVALVWAGCTLVRLLRESWERARITRRFQSYVDPALVQYVIDHPELVRLEGEVREMTVCFTDLVGFTSLTERLREKAVKILGRYIARMVPPIRNHRGLVHRFMGDGIMFSYGAPIANPEMASDAVTTVLEMHDELKKFNDELEAEGYPRLSIRAGVNTGMAVVGDSGADDAAEYACLGDTTNLAARLESANGTLGTATLISGRTVELLKGKFLVRPVALLVVKGRKEAVMTYEPLSAIESATDSQRRLAEMTTSMFDHFVASRFDECIAAADALETAFGPFKLAAIYRTACRANLESPPPDFRGHIVLLDK